MQLPTGSCVLKHYVGLRLYTQSAQLPTGSCVLKQKGVEALWGKGRAATYG